MSLRKLVPGAFALLIGSGPVVALAHGGGLNADGCHNNRKTGDYHCHGAKRTAAPANSFAPSYAAPNHAAPKSRTTFANCSAARAAGAAPVRRGQAGYGSHLDSDGDGVGCE